ncbi:MAG: glycoside hydrolase family 127 protein [Anaerolineaceae bacterium]|nr:glycoside hydrolase family 127 protein [Anaerolineaceae bacterium]
MSRNFLRMLVMYLILLLVCSYSFAKDRGITNTSHSPYVKLRSVDIDDVEWNKGFWADKFKDIYQVGVTNMWEILSDPEIGHAYQNFEIAAGLKDGEFKGTYWHDGDFYKWLEATAYVYAVTNDQKLKEMMDKSVYVIAKAQRKDGYIHTAKQIGHGIYLYNHPTMEQRFEGIAQPFQERGHHELYNFGHLMTAGCIHYRATGETKLLDVAKKAADYLYTVFEPRPKELAHFGWKPSIIMGLVELYRTTRNPKYLKLAGIFVDMQGSQPGGTDQNQDRTPLRKETEAVGNAVSANYLYAGAADVYAETGEKELLDALERVWKNITYQKISVTGGNGPLHRGTSPERDIVREAYSREYHLPNATAYNETCANISNAMFNWRMLAVTGEARFADILELILYNSVLSGISLDCKYFYCTNPLRRVKGTPKMTHYPGLPMDYPTCQSYIPCFCCSTNILRTIAKVHGWAYCVSDEGIWINLYGGNNLNTELDDRTKIKLIQETNYPWDGKVKITIQSPKKKKYAVMLRIPEWVRGATLKANGQFVNQKLVPGTYARVERTWKSGDVIELNMPMPAQLLESNPLVEETRHQVAVKRGPIVYCIEAADLADGMDVLDVVIPADIELSAVYRPDFLGGVTTLEGKALLRKTVDWTNKLYHEQQKQSLTPVKIKLIPYFAWRNRAKSDMTVWLPFSLKINSTFK